MRGILAGAIVMLPLAAFAAEPVTVQTAVRAETDTALRTTLGLVGGELGKYAHLRAVTPIDRQTVIRMNRDTLYSAAVLDLSEPVTLTVPDPGERYLSLHVINQDHYMFVITEPGEHVLSEDKVGSRFAQISVRVFVNPNDPEDVAAANAVQDGLKISGGGKGPFEAPDWDADQLQIVREAVNRLAALGFATDFAFGMPDEVKPVDHLIGAISGWGGLPRTAAYYVLATVDDPSGTPHALTVKDVPVDAFWSVTVYNADGFIEKNDRDAYSYNNHTAKPNGDGSFTIHFGACDDGRANCLPIGKGWNYAVRLYEPRAEILDGSWVFPAPQKIK